MEFTFEQALIEGADTAAEFQKFVDHRSIVASGPACTILPRAKLFVDLAA